MGNREMRLTWCVQTQGLGVARDTEMTFRLTEYLHIRGRSKFMGASKIVGSADCPKICLAPVLFEKFFECRNTTSDCF